jgi:hypothetical protein
MPWSFAWIEILMKTGPVFVQTDKKSVWINFVDSLKTGRYDLKFLKFWKIEN